MTTSNTFVRPNTPLVPETIKLSPVDQYSHEVYTPLLLFFKFDVTVLQDVVCHDLKTGLASLINDVPFLAGNVVMEDEESGNLQVDIPEGAGVMFKVKEMVDSAKGPILDFEELEKASFSSSLLNMSEISPTHYIPELVAPVLLIQANFIRGGLVLTSYIHHSTTDGRGLMTIWKRWAKYVSAAATSRTVLKSESFPEETLDRSILFPHTGTWRNLYEFPGFAKVCNSTTNQPRQKIQRLINRPLELSIAHWYISPANLQAMEELGKPADDVGGSLTASCVLAAFLWQHCTRVRRLERRGITDVSIFVRCDFRRRIDPPLHPDFLGNAVVHCEAKIPLDELLSSKPGTLHRVASLISGCIDWYTSDNMWDLFSAMSANTRYGETEPTMDLFSESVFKITDLSSIPLQDSQWGPIMGNPSTMRLPGVFVLNGEAVVLPRLPDGGLELSTHLPIAALEELKADAEFTKYVEFRCS